MNRRELHQQSPRVVVAGGCSFTACFVLECLSRHVPIHRVVLDSNLSDADPFPGISPGGSSAWVQDHRFYYAEWKSTLATACGLANTELSTTANVFEEVRDADVLVVAGLARKVPGRVLASVGPWALNVHPSILPSHRGPQPEARCILAGCSRTGVTVHSMTSEFDSGPIRFQEDWPVRGRDTVGTLERKAALAAAQGFALLLRGFPHLPEHPPPAGVPASYDTWYRADDVLNLKFVQSPSIAKRVLRLRPEGYAYLRRSNTILYPLTLTRTKRAPQAIYIGSLGLWVAHGVVTCATAARPLLLSELSSGCLAALRLSERFHDHDLPPIL